MKLKIQVVRSSKSVRHNDNCPWMVDIVPEPTKK
jgi:hypothetical protein